MWKTAKIWKKPKQAKTSRKTTLAQRVIGPKVPITGPKAPWSPNWATNRLGWILRGTDDTSAIFVMEKTRQSVTESFVMNYQAQPKSKPGLVGVQTIRDEIFSLKSVTDALVPIYDARLATEKKTITDVHSWQILTIPWRNFSVMY